jgi:hypothetical protein
MFGHIILIVILMSLFYLNISAHRVSTVYKALAQGGEMQITNHPSKKIRIQNIPAQVQSIILEEFSSYEIRVPTTENMQNAMPLNVFPIMHKHGSDFLQYGLDGFPSDSLVEISKAQIQCIETDDWSNFSISNNHISILLCPRSGVKRGAYYEPIALVLLYWQDGFKKAIIFKERIFIQKHLDSIQNVIRSAPIYPGFMRSSEGLVITDILLSGKICSYLSRIHAFE